MRIGWQLGFDKNQRIDTLAHRKVVNITSTTAVFPSTVSIHGSSYYIKIGRLIQMHINFKIVSTNKTNHDITNAIPAVNDRPDYDVTCVGGDGTTNGVAQPFTLTTRGSIGIWNTVIGTTYCQGDCFYIAKDYN